MRIRSLLIEHFGVFSQLALEFPDDALHVVYGPNEAGKSTLLQLIRELLFGFPIRNAYAFAEHAGEMAAVATLETAAGARVRFRRRKGRRDEVVGEYVEGGEPLTAADLTRLLGGATSELFHNVFGFSLCELAAGEHSLEHAKLSEALYGGALGGLAGFQQVLADLEKEQERLFSPAATKRPINQLVAEIRKRVKELRAAQVKPREYHQLEQELQTLEAKSTQLRQERDGLQRQQARCEQLVRAAGLWQQKQLLRDELARLEIPPDFPRDGEQQYERHRATCEQLAGELEDFQQELAEVRSRLETLSPRQDVVERAAEIQRLAQQLDKIRGFRRDALLRHQESETIQRGVASRLRELDPSWTLEHLQRFHASLAHRAAVKNLRDEWDELQAQQRDGAARQQALESDLDELQLRWESLADESTESALAELVEQVGQYETWRERLEQNEQQERELSARRDSLARQLHAPLARPLPELPLAAVPLAATVTEYRQRFVALQQRLERSSLRCEHAADAWRQREQELQELKTQDRVPDREQLEEARTHRDQGWQLIRRKYIAGESVPDVELAEWAGTIPMSESYEQSVQRADEIADRRQQEAEVVARLDQVAREVDQSRRQKDRAEQTHQEHLRQEEVWRREWDALWEPSGIAPQTPDAMLEWLRIHRELVDIVAQLHALAQHAAAERQRLAAFDQRLETELAESGLSPSARIAEARRRVQRAREAAALRDTCAAQLPRKQQQLAGLRQRRASLAQQHEQWQERWQSLLQLLGFPEAWDVHTAAQVLSGLSELRMEQEKAEMLDQRVRDMRQGLEQFDRDVATTCRQLAPRLAHVPAENAVEELVQMLDSARRELQDQQLLAQQRDKLEARCETKRQQLQRERTHEAGWLERAGVSRPENVPEVARRVRRWFELREQSEAVEHQLRALRGSEDPGDFEAAVKQAVPSLLESQQQQLRTELERVDREFQQAWQRQGVAVQQRQELDGSSQAAMLIQDVEGLRSQLADLADRWAPLVLARAFMRRALEQFQREHQPRLLTSVGELLQRMTLGRYTAISRKLDERGSLQIHQADGRIKEPHQLSTGTREQLYLAIRLAYVCHYCGQAEPLPIVMDDVLVNFDDARAAETLEALLEVGRQTQLILLTCHRGTVELVQRRLPGSEPIVLGA